MEITPVFMLGLKRSFFFSMLITLPGKRTKRFTSK
jgi:hypothetical protein